MLRSYRSCRPEERLRTSHRGSVESARKSTAGPTLHCVVGAGHTGNRVENYHDVLAELDQTTGALENHFGDVRVTGSRHIETRSDDFAVTPRDHLAHFFRTLVNEQNEKNGLRMIYCNTFDNCLKQHRLSGACRGHDECALAITNRRNQVDRTTC